jgi:integrase
MNDDLTVRYFCSSSRHNRKLRLSQHQVLPCPPGEGEATDYVLCDELGVPYDPARLRRVWYRLMREAGVPKVTPYTASRHAAASYLGRMKVSPAVIAAWLGHTDASFTMKTYVHARPEDLAAARDALAVRRG